MKSVDAFNREFEKIMSSGKAFANGMQKELNKLPEILEEDETMLFLMGSYRKGEEFLYVCTTKRILMLKVGWVNMQQTELAYEQITNISFETHLLFGSVRIEYGSRTILVRDCAKLCVQPFVETVKERMADLASPKPTRQPRKEKTSTIGEIEKLVKLFEKGYLTKEEFDLQKSKLLSNETER